MCWFCFLLIWQILCQRKHGLNFGIWSTLGMEFQGFLGLDVDFHSTKGCFMCCRDSPYTITPTRCCAEVWTQKPASYNVNIMGKAIFFRSLLSLMPPSLTERTYKSICSCNRYLLSSSVTQGTVSGASSWDKHVFKSDAGRASASCTGL